MSDRIEQSVELFRQGYNCAQAILLVYGGRYGLDRETALRLALGLEGGLGRTGEVCGAVNGACLVLGLEAGGQEDASGAEGRKLARKRVREFSRKFRERHGAVACRQLLGTDLGTHAGMMAARGKRVFSRRCPEFVAAAAQILEEMLDRKS
ncbi:MAG: C_GCAxxG_C_C family protein, partial [Candidatus Glassbacteria bacterium]|nr:C_GCAxxG_C_C family protein [Candidatus Glassbacteria bacterium]